MDTAVIKDLISQIKNKCKITWMDDDTEERVKVIVENAVLTLSHKLGVKTGEEAIFTSAGMERMLFENYCLYEWNEMGNSFEENYQRDIITCRHKNEVANERKKQL